MGRQIYVNLPVKHIQRSKAFFASLGFAFNPQFSDEKALCMIVADDICVMLLAAPFFQTFTNKPVADATKGTEVLVALSCENRDAVDEMVRKALAAGGRAPNPRMDHGFMLQHGFEDLDGHQWEVFHMEPGALPPQA